MTENGQNGRTHEPDLHQVTAELDGLRDLVFAKIEAQKDALSQADTRYEQRFNAQETAVSSALANAEKAVSAALMAADRAVLKAETATEKRFESVNEFRSQLADQATRFLTRSEADTLFKAVTDKIESITKSISTLSEFRSTASGRDEQRGENRQQNQWTIGVAIIVGSMILGLVELAVRMFH